MIRAYGLLLRLYPADYRRVFGREMREVFDRAKQDRAAPGLVAACVFVWVELAGVAVGAAGEWIVKLKRKDYLRGTPAAAEVEGMALPAEVREAEERARHLVAKIVKAIAAHDFREARRYSFEEAEARRRLSVLRQKYRLA